MLCYWLYIRFKLVNDLFILLDFKVYFYEFEKVVMVVIGFFGGFFINKDYEVKFEELKKVLDKDGFKYNEFIVIYVGYSSFF